MSDNDFKYSAKQINDLIDKSGLQKVCMDGVYINLQRLKPIIEEVYRNQIFYLSYWVDECAYHGWDWSKDDGTLENQRKITDGITEKFLEIYALILVGLDERMNEDE